MLEKAKTSRSKVSSEQEFKAIKLFDAFNGVYDHIRQDDAFYRKLKSNETYLLSLKQNLKKSEEEIKLDAEIYMNTQSPELVTAWKQFIRDAQAACLNNRL